MSASRPFMRINSVASSDFDRRTARECTHAGVVEDAHHVIVTALQADDPVRSASYLDHTLNDRLHLFDLCLPTVLSIPYIPSGGKRVDGLMSLASSFPGSFPELAVSDQGSTRDVAECFRWLAFSLFRPAGKILTRSPSGLLNNCSFSRRRSRPGAQAGKASNKRRSWTGVLAPISATETPSLRAAYSRAIAVRVTPRSEARCRKSASCFLRSSTCSGELQ